MVTLIFQCSHRKSLVGRKDLLASCGLHVGRKHVLSCPSLFKIYFLVFSASVSSEICTYKVINS